MESVTQATESELSGRLATAVVQWYHDRFGRGPTESKGYLLDRFVLVVLGRQQRAAAGLGAVRSLYGPNPGTLGTAI